MLGDGPRLLLGQPLELDPQRTLAGRPVGLALHELVACRADHEKLRVARLRDDLLHQLEERRLRPVDVLEQDDGGVLRAERLQQLAGSPRELLRRIRRRREADGCRDPVGDLRVAGERGELRERLLGRVALGDVSRLADGLGERPERDSLAVRKASPAQHCDVVRQRADELVDQSRLPDTGLADHRRQAALTRGHRLCELLLEELELAGTADHGRVEPAWPLSGLPYAHESVRGYPLGLPLELERLDGLDVDVVAHQAVGEVAEEDLLRSGGLLQSCGDVDRVAGDEPLTRRRVAGDDLSRVHARADRELDSPVTLELLVQPHERALHPRCRSNRTERVVLVQRREAEHGHDRVADELLDDAAVALELVAHGVEVARHHLAQRLGVELLAHARRPLQVGEDDRHDLPDLLGGDGRAGDDRGATREAELRDVRVLRTALRAERHRRESRFARGETTFPPASPLPRHERSPAVVGLRASESPYGRDPRRSISGTGTECRLPDWLTPSRNVYRRSTQSPRKGDVRYVLVDE